MKTTQNNALTTTEAQIRIVEIIKSFREVIGQCQSNNIKFTGEIENVGVWDILQLYGRIKSKNKRLFMPGDADQDMISIVYSPAVNCVIHIESERCIKYKPKINTINYN